MPNVILVRGARQLLTLRGPSGPRRGPDLRNLGLIQDGAVLVVDGVIREVGPSRRIENLALARKADEIDASGCVVMPGFVDSCSHLASGPARLFDYDMILAGASASEITKAGGGVIGLARSVQELSFRTLKALALRTLEEAVRHGTTAMEARSGFGLTEAGEIKILRVHSSFRDLPVLVISTLLCARIAPGYERRQDEYIDWVCSHLLPLVKRRKLAEFAAVRFEPGGLSAVQVNRYIAAARGLGLAIRVQSCPGLDDVAISYAVDTGAVSVDDLTQPNERAIARLADSNVVATLLPGTAFYAGSGHFPPARRLIDRGVAVCLASGYHTESSPSQNMQMAIALACSWMRMTPAEAISASTINAAHAIGRAAQTGSLEVGKRADLVIFSVPDYREIPYHFGVGLVDMTMAAGEILVRRPEVRWPAD